MMLDIAVAEEGIQDKNISYTGFLRSSDYVADRLKMAISQTILCMVLSSGELKVRLEN